MNIANQRRTLRSRCRNAGFTLVELLVVVAIVAILGMIAYPSYVNHVIRTNRTAAKSMLLQVADRQEQYFSNNKSYAADLTLLGYTDDGFMIDDQGGVVGSADGDRLYEITLSDTSAATFTVNAAPQLRQASRDGQCGTLTLAHSGLKSQTGASNDCW